MNPSQSTRVQWICKGYYPDGRHAGVAETLPEVCPRCLADVEVRTHCACGHPIANCSQGICRHPFASAD